MRAVHEFAPFFTVQITFRQITQFFTLCTLINGQTAPVSRSIHFLFVLDAFPLPMLVKLLAIFHVSPKRKSGLLETFCVEACSASSRGKADL